MCACVCMFVTLSLIHCQESNSDSSHTWPVGALFRKKYFLSFLMENKDHLGSREVKCILCVFVVLSLLRHYLKKEN